MHHIQTLLAPRAWSIKNRLFATSGKSGLSKIMTFGAIGALFWAGIFFVSLRVLGYFKSIEDLGDILSFKLLSMMLITIFSLLIFSTILTTLSKLYLSRDLYLVDSMPVSSFKIFISRWVESTIDSSWMVILYTLPVFISFGIVYDAGFYFYGMVISSLFFLSVIASGISAVLVMSAVIIIPATRIRTIFIFLGLLLFLVLYLAFRLLRPERFVDPEVFLTTLVYLKSLRMPASPFLPSTWAFDSLRASLDSSLFESIFHMSLLATATAFFTCIVIIIAEAIYFKGVSKSDTAQMRFISFNPSKKEFLFFLPGHIRSFFVKEVKTFFRDQAQWTQIFLIAALIIIYVYNFSVLPLDRSPIKTVYLQNLLSFLNMGLASFVLTAITARFAYPAVSTEGMAYWIANSSPISKKTFLWIKFFIYYVPLLILTEILIVTTNYLLQVSTFMMILSTITVFFIVPGVVAMGIGFGAAYPDFKAENPIQTVTSFGGFLFMVLSAAFIGIIIIIEAGPVYTILMAQLNGVEVAITKWIGLIGAFFLAFIISIAAIVMPMKYGEKRLSEMLV